MILSSDIYDKSGISYNNDKSNNQNKSDINVNNDKSVLIVAQYMMIHHQGHVWSPDNNGRGWNDSGRGEMMVGMMVEAEIMVVGAKW